MVRKDREYRVFKGELTKNGDYTKFSIGESDKGADGKWVTSGWWTVIVKGRYPCDKDDMVKIVLTSIDGVSRRDYNGKTYTTIMADAKILNYGNAGNSSNDDAEEYAGGYPF